MQAPDPTPTDTSETNHPRPGRRWGLWLVVVGIAVAGIALRAFIPPIIEWNSPHDDEALMGAAATIIDGRWLGDWGDQLFAHMTLAKVPGYSLFLAAIHPTGLTPPVASYLLYLVGALLATVAARRVLSDRWAGMIFTALALNPVIFGFNFSRVYRDQLVTALALLALGLTAHLLVVLLQPRVGGWRRWLWLVAETLGLGVTFALLMITRNDIQWILLALAALTIGSLVTVRRDLTWRIGMATFAVLAAVVGIAQAGPITVRALNDHFYGVPLVNDFSEGEMARAVEVWASIETDSPVPFVLVDASQREAAYSVSPTARQLRGELDGESRTWVDLACSLQSPSLAECDDYYGYFAWALRDAATENGVSSPAELQSFFGRLGDELESACATGELTCGPKSFSVDLPPLGEISVRAFATTFTSLVHTSLTRPATIEGYQRAPAGPQVDLWIETVNGADTVATLNATGLQPTSITIAPVPVLLRTWYVWVFTPLTILTLALLFTRRMWTSRVGRLALVCFAGWGANIATTALFYAGSNRNVTGSSPIYIMASQSYLIAGLVLVAASAVLELRRWMRGSLTAEVLARTRDE